MALDRLIAHAETTADPVRYRLAKGDFEAVVCGPRGQDDAPTYCNAALEAAGLEFWHIYPWRLDGCLRNDGYRPLREVQRDREDGIRRGKITRLSVRLRNGFILDQRYTADPNSPYFGKYDLVIWRPEAG